jgi:Flp pilus assembly protein TadG
MTRRLLHRALQALVRFGRDESGGSELVEFAFVGPLVMLLLVGIYQFGTAIWTQGVLDYAVEQAARCASVNTASCASATAITNYAAGLTSPLNLPASTFTSTQPGSGTCSGENKVTASYTFNFVSIGAITYLHTAAFPTSVTLTASSCYPK